jgi:hypothetical protein
MRILATDGSLPGTSNRDLKIDVEFYATLWLTAADSECETNRIEESLSLSPLLRQYRAGYFRCQHIPWMQSVADFHMWQSQSQESWHTDLETGLHASQIPRHDKSDPADRIRNISQEGFELIAL